MEEGTKYVEVEDCMAHALLGDVQFLLYFLSSFKRRANHEEGMVMRYLLFFLVRSPIGCSYPRGTRNALEYAEYGGNATNAEIDENGKDARGHGLSEKYSSVGLKGLMEEGKMEAEVAALYRSGNCDRAHVTAMEYGKEMMGKSELKKTPETRKMLVGMMP